MKPVLQNEKSFLERALSKLNLQCESQKMEPEIPMISYELHAIFFFGVPSLAVHTVIENQPIKDFLEIIISVILFQIMVSF